MVVRSTIDKLPGRNLRNVHFGDESSKWCDRKLCTDIVEWLCMIAICGGQAGIWLLRFVGEIRGRSPNETTFD
jgi:hypothetical protein